MQTVPLVIPRPVPLQRFRPPKNNIPQTTVERNHILQAVRHYVAEFNPVPPMPAEELKGHADQLVEMLHCDPGYRDYVGGILNNEMWRADPPPPRRPPGPPPPPQRL